MTTTDRFSTSHDAALPGNLLLDGMWRSPDLCHQLGTLDKHTARFKNLPVDGVAHAITQALKLSSEGVDVYFACAEFLTPDNRTSGNASGANAFWLDIDCGEDKAAAGKGYATIEDAEDALSNFCKVTGLPKPTHIVHSGGGLHVYTIFDGVVPRDVWQARARQLKGLTKACVFLADDSRTADISSVMRVPGTLNHKYSPPKPVTLDYASDDLIERSVMLDAIDAAHKRLCIEVATKPQGHPPVTSTAAVTSGNADAQGYGPPNLVKLSSALATLDPDCDEETWKLRRIAPLALEARIHPDLSTVLYALTRAWSSGELCGQASTAWITPGGNGLTGEEHFDATWERFLKNEYTGIPVTLGTIFHDAMQLGWVAAAEAKCTDPEDQLKIITVVVGGDA